MAGDFGNQRGSSEDEHAGIPHVPPAGQEGRRRRRVRLFDEFIHHMGAGDIGQRLANLNRAIAGFGRGGLHAEGDNAAVARRISGNGKGGVQRRQVLHRMIGRHHPQHRIRIGFRHQ